MPKNIAKSRNNPTKPQKPSADFPLFAHATGQWAKKINGVMRYFGVWADPLGALDRYTSYTSGEPQSGGPLTVRELVNRFLTAKTRKMEAGELQAWTFNGYYKTAAMVVDAMGHQPVADLRPDDFEQFRVTLAKGRGPVSLSNHIQAVRSIFKYGFDAGLIDVPVRFGPEFKKPSRKTIRLARRAGAERLFTAAEIKAMLAMASKPLKAMILLGINCGMGNTDVASLPQSAVDLDAGVIQFPRPKTGIDRRAPMWKETLQAIRDAIEVRPKAKQKDAAGLVFITRFGYPWVRTAEPKRRTCVKCSHMYFEQADDAGVIRCPECGAIPPKRKTKASMTDSVRLEFQKVMHDANVPNSRGFYCLRHTFRTVADELNDRPAIDRIMGHENAADMRTHYVERIDDARLRAVTGHVHRWLYRPAKRMRR